MLRYDDRGNRQKHKQHDQVLVDNFTEDAAAALNWLKKDSGLRLTKSGYIGHSLGETKSLLAAQISMPDFIVSLAEGSVESLSETIIRQSREISEKNGKPSEFIRQQTKENKDVLSIIERADSINDARKRLGEYYRKSGASEKNVETMQSLFATPWWLNAVKRGDGKGLISSYPSPMLALYGGKDLLVSAKVNEPQIKSLLAHSKSRAKTFPDLNHLFQYTEKGLGPDEYWELEMTFDETVADEIDHWLSKLDTPEYKQG